MKKLTQATFINALLLIALLVLTGSVAIAYWQMQNSLLANERVVHTYEVIQKANQMMLSLNDAELNVHDYLLSNDKQYVENVPALFQATTYNLALLKDITKDNLPQQQRIAKLEPLINAKVKFLQNAITGPNPNLASAKMEVDKTSTALSASITALVSEIKSHEISLLQSRSIVSANTAKISNALVILSGTIGDILLLAGFILLVYNVRQRQLAEQQKSEIEYKLKKIIDSSDDLIAALDLQGRIIAFNAAYQKKLEDTFNIKIDTGVKLKDALNEFKDQTELMNHWERALSGEEFTIVHQLSVKEGDGQIYEATYNTIRDADYNAIGAAHIMRDVTERKKVEHLKNEFVSIVSHELRTPLTSIRGSISLMLAGTTGKIDGKTLAMLNIANNNCDRLVKLINDILDIEKIESGKLEFHMVIVDLNDLAAQAVADNEEYIKKFDVSIKLEKNPQPVLVRADAERLMQVFNNLISNAAKFSPPKDEISVSVSLEGEMARVSITDRGPGVPESFTKHIFEKFSQADSSAIRKHGGSGLGLSISKAIIDMHNGQINFISNKDKKTIFYFEIPLWNERTNSQISDLNQFNADEKKRILYVEDDKDLSEIVSSVLLDEQVVCVNSMHQALKELAHDKFDLILLDLTLPDGFATEILPKLSLYEIPIIIFTAYELPEQYEKYVTKVLTKSKTDNETLKKTISDALAKSYI